MIDYEIDPETLHERLRDPAAAQAELDALLAAAQPEAPSRAMAWHTEIGNAARLLQRLELAEHHQLCALQLASRHGTPRQAVLARVRYAHVLQWQRRFDEVRTQFDRCIEDVDDAGPAAHFVYQHAGKCAYDEGRWSRARELFATALRLREADRADEALIASSRLALDAADACAAAAAAAVELHRLVPAVHAAARPHAAGLFAPVRPFVGFVVDIRTLLLHGAAPLAAVHAIHRYQPSVDKALAALADRWLVVDGGTVVATARCTELLARAMTVFDDVCTELWGEPGSLLSTVDAAVAAGRGTSGGAAFDALADAGHPGGGTVAGRLFTGLCALRYHRADAHAAAWAAERLTARTVGELPDDHPTGQRIEAATDRAAARPYRPLPHRDRLLADLRALPGEPPSG